MCTKWERPYCSVRSISNAPNELVLGSSPRQAAGTVDSYLLVVSGVDPRWTKVNPTWLYGRAPRRPHNHTKIRGYWMKTIRLLLPDSHSGPKSGLALLVNVVSP
ncbi:hypothetical protein N7495_004862 [Penicillium taxi]|uniref:uncharacterized protein n=1 Tax=Penicillium taxi TaxID=168475 RepID=UPI0025457C46|nr:uncharacterized protein N7495_004862 [Penicillium taxi]KAJ5900118.1 hypothetical protein N7495_004862 [Penicillium taxi]